MTRIDWPLAIELAFVFVVLSYVRWRWFRSRFLRRRPMPPHEGPPPG
jgi:hypothetical protein